MNHFRVTFPNASVTPKLHLMEHHIVEFIRKWKAGFGLYREQGAEGIHPTFNNLHDIHCRMKPLTRRLKDIMDSPSDKRKSQSANSQTYSCEAKKNP